MKKFQSLLALAAVAILAVACDDAAKSSGTPTPTTDTVSGDIAAADVPTTADVPADVAAAATGCTAAADMAYLGGLAKDQAAADKFQDDIKGCLLGKGASKPDQKSGSEAIGTCVVVDKKYPITETCATCYGIRAYCAFKNCVANPAEAPTAKCLDAPGGVPCIDCQTKYKCIEASESCKAGK